MTRSGPDDTLPYRVSFVVCVDRPELRGSSYAPVAPGTRTALSERFATQGVALRMLESLLRGDWDFDSEYVARASVVQLRPASSPRVVRRAVDRARRDVEGEQQRLRRALAVGAVRRMRDRDGNQPDWMFPLVWRFPPRVHSAASASDAVADAGIGAETEARIDAGPDPERTAA